MKDRCPEAITKQAYYDETLDYCRLTERPSGRIQVCVLESGEECEEYNDYLEELHQARLLLGVD